jgi:nucleoside-diphosphate-sugar epimerase
MDRIHRGRPVLVPGPGGWLRQFGHVEDLAEVMAALLGDARAYGQAYNVMGEDVISQVGFVELIAEVIGRPVTLRHFDAALLKSFDKPGLVFGQNLVYDCHAVYTTARIRAELGIAPHYTLPAGLAQTFEWYLREGLDRRDVDFTAEDRVLAGRTA